jgi:hypothetical protein
MSNPGGGRPATTRYGRIGLVQPPGRDGMTRNAKHVELPRLLAGLVVRVHSGEQSPRSQA